jgi:hypothetical protein
MLESAIWTAATFFPLVEFGGAVAVAAIEKDFPSFETSRYCAVAAITTNIADRPGKRESLSGNDPVIGRWREEIGLCC